MRTNKNKLGKIHNHEVAGSIPAPATKRKIARQLWRFARLPLHFNCVIPL